MKCLTQVKVVLNGFFFKKMGLFFVYFRSFSNKHYNFYYKSMWKNVMSFQYPAPGFKPTTFGMWVSSHNHLTRVYRSLYLVPNLAFSIVFCWHWHTTSHSTTPHPMNRARKWFTVVTLLYCLCYWPCHFLIPFQQFTIHNVFYWKCYWLDSIPGPLVPESTTQPTLPQLLPMLEQY